MQVIYFSDMAAFRECQCVVGGPRRVHEGIRDTQHNTDVRDEFTIGKNDQKSLPVFDHVTLMSASRDPAANILLINTLYMTGTGLRAARCLDLATPSLSANF